jgi:pimeloyl-ACP methyl ester carboxylesterase
MPATTAVIRATRRLPHSTRAGGRGRFAALLTIALALPAFSLMAAEPVDLKTFELGSGPTLVFVPDIGMGRGCWMPVARRLLSTHHVVLVDLPGHGESPMLQPFSLEAATEALDRVLAGQKADSTILVGHGVGGLLALMEGKAHPERVRAVVTLDSGIRFAEGVADQQKKDFMEYLDEHYDEIIRTLFVRSAHDSAQGVTMHAQASLVAKPVVMAYLRQLVYADQTTLGKGFKLPVLAVCSSKLWPADKEWAVLSKDLGLNALPDVTPHRIGDSGHFMMADHPDSLAASITEFEAKVLAKK